MLSESASSSERRPAIGHGTLASMGARLALETMAARAVGRLSRAAGRGGGTTLPGQAALEARSRRDRRARPTASRRRRRSSRRRTARRRRPRWRPGSSDAVTGWPGTTPAPTSPRASPPRCSPRPQAELGLLEVDEFALPEVIAPHRPRAVVLGNLFRDQLDRYGELEHIAERWRDAVAALPETASLVVNADDPLVASLAADRSGATSLRRRRPAARPAGAPARGRLEVLPALRPAVRLRRGVRRSPRRLPLRRMRASRGRRSTSRPGTSSSHGLEASSFELVTPAGTIRVRLPLPGPLQRLQRSRRRVARARARSPLSMTSRAGLEGFTAAFGRFERIEAGDRRILMLLIKNPAGANEAIRTLEEGGVPSVLVVALNDDDRRRARRLLDLGRRLRAAARRARADRRQRRSRRGAGAALRLRQAFRASRLEVVPDLGRALDRGLELVPAGRRARRAADLHGDAAAACGSPSSAASCGRTGSGA